MRKCRRPARQRISTTIDKGLYDRLVSAIEKEWGGPFSSWLDYVATCWLQEDCNNCPYAEEEGQKKAGGIGRIE